MSTENVLALARAVVEGYEKRDDKKDGRIVVMLYDLEKAFDTIPRDIMFALLKKAGAGEVTMQMIKIIQENAEIRVKANDVRSRI